MRTTILCLLMCLATAVFGGTGGNTRDYERKLGRADLLYSNGNYRAALKMYLELFEVDSTNCNLCYKIGVCYLKTDRQGQEALPFFRKAVLETASDYVPENIKEKRAPLLAHKQLGDAYHLAYRFDEALLSYHKFKQSIGKPRGEDKELIKDVDRRIDMCITGKELMACPAEVKILNLGNSVNSAYPEYSPRVSADQGTMIFTSRRPENTGGRTYDGGQYFEDIYIARKKDNQWQKAENIGWPVNTVGNEAAIGISADGQEILIYKDDMGDGNIYSSTLEGDKWSVPKKLNENINSPHWEPAAFLSADGKTLFFVSDRPGGFGGTDLYKSTRQKNGDWGRAVNLGPTVNTPFDEHSPFIHPDGKTLFFSSRGHRTMGGYDIFFTQPLPSDDRVWIAPVNVGYPINTTGDDAFYMVSADKQSAYYSSMKEDAVGDKDIYMVTFPDVKEPPLALVKGKVLDSADRTMKNVVITVVDNETRQVEGVYRANSKTGDYLFVLTPGKSHNISYEAEGRLFHSENKYIPETNKFVEEARDVKLADVKPGSRITLNNIFFDFDDARLKPYSMAELDKLAEYLSRYPGMVLEVKGFADSQGADEYNLRLSKERAQSVVNYLVSRGIDKKRLQAAGGGTSLAENGSKAGDPSGRSYDRRVELRIVKVKQP